MPTDTRLSRMLHVLIHMDQFGAPVTSEVISRMLETHPVVVRRTMAGLRDAGYVTSVKGHGGGWALARSLDGVTLRDIHEALGSPTVVAIGLAEDNPLCRIERAVHDALKDVIADAEQRLLARFGEVTLGALSRSVGAAVQPRCDGASRH
ncbi:Rrf2 family transcriptional regulator [Myxococcota bacterium]|nr:Rrf2 family transcriptional regulator [Myxococcota bacterium]